jgi:hypothetical protein
MTRKHFAPTRAERQDAGQVAETGKPTWSLPTVTRIDMKQTMDGSGGYEPQDLIIYIK